MFNFVSLLKYKRQMTGNKLCKPAQRSNSILIIIEHSILIIIELYKLVHILSLLSPVSTRVNRFEWRIDLLLMTQSSSGKDSKDMKENFEKRVTW